MSWHWIYNKLQQLLCKAEYLKLIQINFKLIIASAILLFREFLSAHQCNNEQDYGRWKVFVEISSDPFFCIDRPGLIAFVYS